MYKNKQDEHRYINRNKGRLVVQGYNQEKGIDYDEAFYLVAKIEAIRILIAFSAYIGLKLFQMAAKSDFLNGNLKEEVYVKQSLGFEHTDFPYHMLKLHKALYGLK